MRPRVHVRNLNYFWSNNICPFKILSVWKSKMFFVTLFKMRAHMSYMNWFVNNRLTSCNNNLLTRNNNHIHRESARMRIASRHKLIINSKSWFYIACAYTRIHASNDIDGRNIHEPAVRDNTNKYYKFAMIWWKEATKE